MLRKLLNRFMQNQKQPTPVRRMPRVVNTQDNGMTKAEAAAEAKYPHIVYLLDGALRYPAGHDEFDPRAVLPWYARSVATDLPDLPDPQCTALLAELTDVLAHASDQELIDLVGTPGSQDRWEFGCPSLDRIREVFADYKKAIEKTQKS